MARYNNQTNYFLVNLGTLLKGTMSQIVYLTLCFYFMAKKQETFYNL